MCSIFGDLSEADRLLRLFRRRMEADLLPLSSICCSALLVRLQPPQTRTALTPLVCRVAAAERKQSSRCGPFNPFDPFDPFDPAAGAHPGAWLSDLHRF
ncbi:hypothetical protein EYF80_055547 [Liparis tanakae]|uniref:Uncharacterized protein n=1 Tax=Liparis tanakae TaxID=230148 RepID=A0A4Z2F0V7_9TELE|nr:hypothetical protein EYF80_055547 [Liparis tanakae]